MEIFFSPTFLLLPHSTNSSITVEWKLPCGPILQSKISITTDILCTADTYYKNLISSSPDSGYPPGIGFFVFIVQWF